MLRIMVISLPEDTGTESAINIIKTRRGDANTPSIFNFDRYRKNKKTPERARAAIDKFCPILLAGKEPVESDSIITESKWKKNPADINNKAIFSILSFCLKRKRM